jgi:hypothetical protein
LALRPAYWLQTSQYLQKDSLGEGFVRVNLEHTRANGSER